MSHVTLIVVEELTSTVTFSGGLAGTGEGNIVSNTVNVFILAGLKFGDFGIERYFAGIYFSG